MSAHTIRTGLVARAAAFLAAASAALALAGPGEAARLVSPVQATCWRVTNTSGTAQGRILVTSPEMETGGGAFFTPQGNLIVNPMQRAAFRVHLTRWNGTRWAIVASSPWKAQDITLTSSPDTWLDLSTGRLVGGGHTFWFSPGFGSLAVYAEYHWYANQYFSAYSEAGYTWLHYDQRLPYSGAQPYCTY
jgi:hypothetical protein